MEWVGSIFEYDDTTKKIYKDGMRVWQDTDNQIGDERYYPTFADWVMEEGDLF